MKTIIRIPLDQYAYIELEAPEGTTAEAALDIYADYNKAFIRSRTVGKGLDKATFDAVLDDYCWHSGTVTPDVYAAMDAAQQETMQTIKRSKKREEYKARKQLEDHTKNI